MKNVIQKLFVFSLFFVGSLALAFSEPHVKWVSVSPDRELYVEFYPPQKGQPTVVLLNGLTYSTRSWDQMTQALVQKGFGVVAYDMQGQGQTLLRYAPALEVYKVEAQIEDLKVLLQKLKIPAPYHLLGLSYGGGVAVGFGLNYPQLVKNLILMAPYTKPLVTLDQWIQSQVWATRRLFPATPWSDDELYDFYYRQIVYATYPQSEPTILENPFKLEAVFRMGQGIRKFVPEKEAHQLQVPVHLIVARNDQYIAQDVLDSFWQQVPVAQRMSRIYINGSEHKIPEAVPSFAAGWVQHILNQQPALFKNKDFEGWPLRGVAQSKDETIPVEKN